MDVSPYTVIVMSYPAEPEPSKTFETRTQLQSAYLIRCLNEGRNQYFILEDVETRERQRFDSSVALLAHLNEIFLTE